MMKLKNINSIMILLLLLLVIGSFANLYAAPEKLVTFDHEYREYGKMLNKFVADGKVKYAALKADPNALDIFVKSLGSVVLKASTKDEQLAFYINAYNAITLKSVVDAYPVKSIKDIDGVWDDREWLVAGDKLTLNDIEHKVLRKKFDEPRLHVAINCASVGCPVLLSEAYVASKIEDQLREASELFANSTVHNMIDEKYGDAKLSALFDWFGDDFIGKYNSKSFPNLSKKEKAVMNFLTLHLPKERQVVIKSVKFDVEYLTYDWSLNEAN